MHSQICNVACNGKALGYAYCGYRDCSNEEGDFNQVVGKCDPRTATRKVTYELKNGSTCINANRKFSETISIGCDYTPFPSQYGNLDSALAAVGIIVCALVLMATWYYHNDKAMRGSQLVFVYTFLLGAVAMNLSIFVLLGPASDAVCVLRPWVFNLSATMM